VPGPHIPTPLDQLGARPFSFYPSITGTDHNEWVLQGASAEEIQVRNTKTQQTVWIARRLVSGVSGTEEPVVIVGLVKDLEYREGMVVPLVRRVLEMRREAMPQAVNDVPWRTAAPPPPGYRAPVVGIRLASEPDIRKGRSWLARIAAGILTCLVGLIVYREGPFGVRAKFFSTPPRVALPFTPDDDYFSIVSRLGRPAAERVRKTQGPLAYYLLRYPNHGYVLVLLGTTRDDSRYVGALGRTGRIIHTVQLPDGQDSAGVLMGLRR